MKLKLASGVLVGGIVLWTTSQALLALPDRPAMQPPPMGGPGMGKGPGPGNGPEGPGGFSGPGMLGNKLGAPVIPPSSDKAGASAEGESVETPVPTLANPANPYGAILARNVFGLKPVPPPPPPTNANDVVQVGSLKLTGFMRFSGSPLKALFMDTPKDPKSETFYATLSEGEVQGQLQIVKLMREQEAAEVVYAGNRLTLYLKDSKPTNSMPAAPVPGQPMPPQPGGVRPPTQVASVIGGAGNQGGGGVSVGGGIAPANPTAAAGAQTQIPSRTLRGGATAISAQSASAQATAAGITPPQTAQESVLRTLADQELHKGQIFPPIPPLPGSQ